jgi:hypothetical protein
MPVRAGSDRAGRDDEDSFITEDVPQISATRPQAFAPGVSSPAP